MNAAQHSVQWTGGYAPRFTDVFPALSFSRLDSESQPTQLPLTRAVGRLSSEDVSLFYLMFNSLISKSVFEPQFRLVKLFSKGSIDDEYKTKKKVEEHNRLA